MFHAQVLLLLNLDPIYVFGPDQSAEQTGGMSAVYRAVEVDMSLKNFFVSFLLNLAELQAYV